MRIHLHLLAATAVAVASNPAAAAAPALSPFTACDGYFQPSRSADGLNSESIMFGLVTQAADQRRSTVPLGASGVAACDRALADPSLKPEFAMRRAHLMQARAMHLIASGKLDDALTSLNQSDGAGANEPLFAESLGQGNRALRATALLGLGRKAEAEAVLAQLERLRPYATSQRQLALQVRLQFEDDLATQMKLLRETSRLDPRALHQMFWMSMLYDDFPSAIAYGLSLSFDDPRDHGGWTTVGAEFEPYKDLLERSRFAGAYAYAESAMGDDASSAETLKRMEQEIAPLLLPMPKPARNQRWTKYQIADHDLKVKVGTAAMALLKNWAGNIALRKAAKGQTATQLLAELKTSASKPIMLSDLLMQLSAPQPGDTAQLAQLKAEVAATKDELRKKQLHASFPELVRLLPRPETLQTRIKYQTEGAGIMRSDLNGYAVKRNARPGSFTVRFGSATGSVAAVDEAVLYAAANYVLKEGKDAFLIDAREPIQRTIQMTGMYSGGRRIPSGYEVRLSIRPVSSATVSATDRQRLVMASDVIAAVGPKFATPAG